MRPLAHFVSKNLLGRRNRTLHIVTVVLTDLANAFELVGYNLNCFTQLQKYRKGELETRVAARSVRRQSSFCVRSTIFNTPHLSPRNPEGDSRECTS